MPTLLLSRTCRPEGETLATAARQAGWNLQWLGSRRTPTHLHGNDFALYAQTDIALRVARRHGLALIEPSLDLLAALPRRYTLRTIRFLELGDAESLDERIFVKPADCTAKLFDAAVYESGSRILRSDDLTLDTPVLVSEPVAWENEYRAVIHEREVVAYSPYIRGGWLARSADGQWPCSQAEIDAMIAFCRGILDDRQVDVPPAFVLDVGTIAGRGWAVIEMNPIWCSGLLGCDLGAVLPALRRACRRRSELTTGDELWLLDR